jgi:hypothetical protein
MLGMCTGGVGILMGRSEDLGFRKSQLGRNDIILEDDLAYSSVDEHVNPGVHSFHCL